MSTLNVLETRKSARLRFLSVKLRTSEAAFEPTVGFDRKSGTSRSKATTISRVVVKEEETERKPPAGYIPSPSPSKRKYEPEPDSHLIRESSTSPKKPKATRKYAPPEKYAHLDHLTDYLAGDLDVVFCGINPGCRSAEVGHHFAHPTNHFWKCLHQAGFTERQLDPSEDVTLPERYNLGMTDLVERPSSEEAELSKTDMLGGVPLLLAKVAKYRPRIVCFVGKGIGEIFCNEAIRLGSAPETSSSTSKKKRVFKWGLQNCKVVHPPSDTSTVEETLFFIMPSSSARVTGYQLADKVKIVKTLYRHVEDLRAKVQLVGIDVSKMALIQTSRVIATAISVQG